MDILKTQSFSYIVSVSLWSLMSNISHPSWTSRSWSQAPEWRWTWPLSLLWGELDTVTVTCIKQLLTSCRLYNDGVLSLCWILVLSVLQRGLQFMRSIPICKFTNLAATPETHDVLNLIQLWKMEVHSGLMWSQLCTDLGVCSTCVTCSFQGTYPERWTLWCTTCPTRTLAVCPTLRLEACLNRSESWERYQISATSFWTVLLTLW